MEEAPGSEQETSGIQSMAHPIENSMQQGKVASNNDSSFKAVQIAGGHHIMFGRGRACNDNPGNQRMRRIIEKYKGQYMGTGTRAVKRRVVRKAYEEIVKGGVMFLKQVGNDDKWVPVDQEVAIDKVSHALRCRKGLTEADDSSQEPSAGSSGATKKPPPASSSIRSLQAAMISHEAMAPPEVTHEDQMPSSASGLHSLESEVLMQTFAQRQVDHSLRLKALLIRQLQTERLRTEALIQSLPFLQTPEGASELEALQSMERRDQEIRRILALRRGATFPGL